MLTPKMALPFICFSGSTAANSAAKGVMPAAVVMSAWTTTTSRNSRTACGSRSSSGVPSPPPRAAHLKLSRRAPTWAWTASARTGAEVKTLTFDAFIDKITITVAFDDLTSPVRHIRLFPQSPGPPGAARTANSAQRVRQLPPAPPVSSPWPPPGRPRGRQGGGDGAELGHPGGPGDTGTRLRRFRLYPHVHGLLCCARTRRGQWSSML